MKKLFAPILLLLCSALSATEIQCQTNIKNIDAVIKKSPDTGIYYLLIFQDNEVNPIPLTNNRIEDAPPVFRYKEEQLFIEINLNTRSGVLDVVNEPRIHLIACYNSELK